MKSTLIVILIFVLTGSAYAWSGFRPISNEISLFKNIDDFGDWKGYTTQFVSINLVYSIPLTIVVDHNFDPSTKSDYYSEIGFGIPVYKKLSVSCQRVTGTFIDSYNQIGLSFKF